MYQPTKDLGGSLFSSQLFPNQSQEATEQVIPYILSQIHTILPLSYEVSPKAKSNLKSTF